MTTRPTGRRNARSREEARAYVLAWAMEEMQAGREVTEVESVNVNGKREWRVREGAEEGATVEVYPDEWFRNERCMRSTEGDKANSPLSVLAASALAGAPKEVSDRQRLRRELHQATGGALWSSGWSQVICGLRKDEWLELIEREGLSWRRAAEILRTLDLDFGRLTELDPGGWTGIVTC